MRQPDWFATAWTWITRLNAVWSLTDKVLAFIAGGAVASFLRWFGSGWPLAAAVGLFLVIAVGWFARRQRRKQRRPLLQWLNENDPERNLESIPSSHRTEKAKREGKPDLYFDARQKAIDLGLNPPLPTGDNRHDFLTLRQWCEKP